MDPEKTLEQLSQSWLISDWAEVRESCRDLHRWINEDGFVPQLTKPQLSAMLNMCLGYAMAQEMAQQIHEDPK